MTDPTRTTRLLTERMPPYNIEAEMGVLGSILLDGSSIHEVASALAPGDFYRDDHERAYTAILGLQAQGKPIDATLATEEMVRRGLGRPQAIELVVGLVESVPHAAHAAYYADIVLQKSRSRKLIGAANQILEDNYSDRYDADDLCSRAERAVFGATQVGTSGFVHTLDEAMGAVLDRAFGDRDAPRPGRITTGLKSLDNLVGFIEPGQLVVIGARTSIGKSALALGIAGHVAEYSGNSTLFASLEMNASEVATRYLAAKADVNSYRIAGFRELREEDRRALEIAKARFAGVPLLIDESGRQSVASIAARARRLKARGSLAAVFVDYLSLVTPEGPASTPRHQQVAGMTWGFKSLAKELAVPVFLLVQINRESESGRGQVAKPGQVRDHRPRLHHLKDSGAIEQDANMVILLHRPDFYDPADQPGVAELYVAKNRGGATGLVRLSYNAKRTSFGPLTGKIDEANHPF